MRLLKQNYDGDPMTAQASSASTGSGLDVRWPELMRADTAARYVDERSPRTFRRRVGKLYPKPVRVPGRGDLWPKIDLDMYLRRLRRSTGTALDDAADVL